MQSVRFRSLLGVCLLGAIGLSGCSNLSVAVAPKVTQADLRKIKKVAIQLDAGGSAGMPNFGGFRMMGGGGSTEAFSDHFAVELLKLGIDVVERTQLDRVMKEQALKSGRRHGNRENHCCREDSRRGRVDYRLGRHGADLLDGICDGDWGRHA